MQVEGYGYTAQAKLGYAEYTYRPLVDVEVSGLSKTRRFKALVDSGTEITVMDKSIALLLNIDLKNRQTGKLSGLGEWRDGVIAPVSLKVDRFSDVFTFSVLFVEDLQRNFDIILGQQDFFRSFDVTFRKSKNMFYLERE